MSKIANAMRKIKIGFRGAALIIFGLLWVVIGLSVLEAPTTAAVLFYTKLPLIIRGGMWIGAGLVAILAAFLIKWPSWQARGFVILFIAPCILATSFLWAVIFHFNGMWLRGLGIYSFFLASVILVSAWPEPCKPSAPETRPPSLPEGGVHE